MNIVIFISGRGSNYKALTKKITEKKLNINIVKVVCDQESAPGLKYAKKMKHEFILLKKTIKKNISIETEKKLALQLKKLNVDLILLAGYMQILKFPLLEQFKNKIINIHPSLLPKYPGLYVQKRALEAGDKVSGCTVHLVNEKIDGGRILGQKTVSILNEDTVESLSQKILEQEHHLYFEILKKIYYGKITLE